MKCTEEQFNLKILKLYPNIEVLTKYTKMREPIKARCKTCGHEWELKLAYGLLKSGCPKCSLIEKGKRHRVSKGEFINKLYIINPNIVALDNYVTAKTKIKFKCLICGNEWQTTPDSVLHGTGCPKCAIEKVHNQLKLSLTEITNKLNIINPNVIITGNYINNKIPLECFCNKHLISFNSKVSTIMFGKYVCPECLKEGSSQTQLKSNKEFLKQLLTLNKNIQPLETYKGSHTKIAFKCLSCGYVRKAYPTNILTHGEGCPICAGRKINSLENFIEEANIIHNNKYDYSKAIYEGRHNKITIICPTHGEFKQEAGSHLSGCGCPKCNESKGELLVQKVLQELNISFIPLFKIKNTLYFPNNKFISVDFLFIYNNLEYFIEYNGKLHYVPVKYFGGELKFIELQKRDSNLRKYCLDNQINLLEIKYTEKLDNIKSLIKKFINYEG